MRRLRITLAVSAALAVLITSYGTSVQAAAPPIGVSRSWNRQDLAVLASLRLSELPGAPDDPSNAWDDSAAAAALGKLLFFDPRFSRNQAVSCSSCHDPARQFQDGRKVGEGVGVGSRRSMPIVAAGYSPWLFWDGRKDSLWSQALGPLEDPLEHGGNRLRYARLMQSHYSQSYVDLFGPMPDLGGLPEDASPLGTAADQQAWRAMEPAARDAVSRVFANMGKAIAAYERSLHHEPSRLDRYIEQLLGSDLGGPAVLTPQEVRGLRLFIGKGDCVSCHNGPLFTDQQFHNTGVPPRDANRPDPGRAAATARVRGDEFNCLGPYSDANPDQCQELRFLAEGDAQLEGAFKTPGLRGVALRPPYMHAGQFASL
ncbi:MAG TPA: cytochrome c peroxidase, partial [Steroidobacteraceae bacterium]|nr:cytochrome c peroxidase [Steroidobacteraceae bacterium]